jgi:hypothetical protein
MMLHPSTAPTVKVSGEQPRAPKPTSARVSLVERVRERLAELGCERIWARGAGSQVLLGLRGEDAYARLTPVRDSLYGLAFRTPTPPPTAAVSPIHGWEPLLLVDTLEDLVEHALVAVDAIPE